MRGIKSLFLILVLVISLIFSIIPVSANSEEVKLNVCWENPNFLTDDQLKELEKLIKQNFEEAGVEVTFSKSPPPCNPDGARKVSVKFVRDGAMRTGDRTCQVDISRSERKGATSGQIVRGIADTTAHEIAEIYLEDLAPDPNNPYKMEGYFNWTDAQDLNLTFSEENKKLLRKFIKEDNITYKKELDEVAHIILPPTYKEEPVEVVSVVSPKTYAVYDKNFSIHIYAEPMTEPLINAKVEFNELIKLTDDEGKAEFMTPIVEEPTKYSLSASYPRLEIEGVEIMVYPLDQPTEDLFEEIESYVETKYNPNIDEIPWVVKSSINNENINAHITLEDNTVLTIGVQTNEEGVAEKVKKGEISNPTMNVYTNENTVYSIMNSQNPVNTVQEALSDDKITYKGVGLMDKVKLSIVSAGLGLYSVYTYITELIG